VHRYFADWYRVAAIEPQPDVLAKRWEAIEGLVYTLDVPEALEVVRLFFGSARGHARFVERYRDAFKAADVTFQMRDNDVELRVLAGATLASLLQGRGGPVADVVALAAVCADCRRLRPGDRIGDILREARSHLSSRSAALRLPRHVRTVAVPALDLEAMLEPLHAALQARQTRDPAFEGVMEPPSPSARAKASPASEVVVKAIETVAAAVLEVAAAAAEVAEEQGHRLRIQREETNVLWWLFGEHSRDLERPMASLPLPAACLVAGKELADLVEVLPGPVAAAGVLDRMLRAVEREPRAATTIQEAVNGAPRDWRTEWAAAPGAERLEDLCPVLCAVRRSLDTSGADDWLPPVRTLTGVDVAAGIRPLDLAVQAYEERLLVGAVRQNT
jgi:hypothetical protein